MTIDFHMSQQEYLRGCRYKMKKQAPWRVPGLPAFLLAAVTLAFAFLMRADTLYLLLPAILVGFGVAEQLRINAAFVGDFNTKPYLYGEQRLTVEDGGVRVQNGFEKLYTDFHKIYAVKCTKKEIILLLTYRKGVYVINREAQDAAAITALLTALRAKGVRVNSK